jgi:hypothetical protein
MSNFNNDSTITSKVINLYLDNQLPHEQQAKIQEQAVTDPRISKIIRQERDFRDFVKNSVKPIEVSSHIIDRLKEQITGHS